MSVRTRPCGRYKARGASFPHSRGNDENTAAHSSAQERCGEAVVGHATRRRRRLRPIGIDDDGDDDGGDDDGDDDTGDDDEFNALTRIFTTRPRIGVTEGKNVQPPVLEPRFSSHATPALRFPRVSSSVIVDGRTSIEQSSFARRRRGVRLTYVPKTFQYARTPFERFQ